MSKFKGKAKKKLAPVIRAHARVFNYTSVCCEAPGKKPPVQRDPADIAENKYSECHLGRWHCTKCGRNCKVTRTIIKETDGAATVTTASPEGA